MSEGELELIGMEEDADGLVVFWAETMPEGGQLLAKSVRDSLFELTAEVRRLREENTRFQYAARVAVLTGWSYCDDEGRTKEWFEEELARIQGLIEGEDADDPPGPEALMQFNPPVVFMPSARKAPSGNAAT